LIGKNVACHIRKPSQTGLFDEFSTQPSGRVRVGARVRVGVSVGVGVRFTFTVRVRVTVRDRVRELRVRVESRKSLRCTRNRILSVAPAF